MKYKKKGITITIDGPAGSGKSTIARILAMKISYNYINTGDLYRYVTYCAIKNKLNVNSPELMDNLSKKIVEELIVNRDNLEFIFQEDSYIKKQIHSPDIDKKVSLVARHFTVRKNLIPLQRLLAENKSIVMEGRDIGSVILPNADLKFYLIANEKTRTDRRYKELKEKGFNVTIDEVKSEIKKRDQIDSKRKFAPLTIPEDAIIVDTSDKSIEEVINLMLENVKSQESV
ncbi:MAG: (d)CMP kinase [Candidatus Caldatribacteriota bacterium]|nr:(d)CMP kinase [Atribacterota bacterium]MDD3640183.1 (d)CMP kinase [Atribacterota bacterium]MDD4288277.1 (d)CMP kinase [Atribacterota bacterium]MDD4764643.1 (d)CMP kinase [Atribacterota bacterium]MDI9596325.1 (d)CMP kinase [Atribacterota bacterium]